MGRPAPLKLRDVRSLFRLIGEVRELGAQPQLWRPHMIQGLQELLSAEIVISSEVHFRHSGTGPDAKMRVIDIGWGCDADHNVWQIHTERDDEIPESYWLLAETPQPSEALVPVRPAKPLHGGSCFVLSQYPLAHLGAVDQLGLHRTAADRTFTPSEHRLVRLFHLELGRLWKRDALRHAKDPSADLPPRLTQTLSALLDGLSEKQIALKLDLSQHTVHNYVKALHQRFEVNSRGELLAKAGKIRATFLPQFSVQPPAGRP
jgi:DNA-binding CsgD family transcriptional regulator